MTFVAEQRANIKREREREREARRTIARIAKETNHTPCDGVRRGGAARIRGLVDAVIYVFLFSAGA